MTRILIRSDFYFAYTYNQLYLCWQLQKKKDIQIKSYYLQNLFIRNVFIKSDQ
jgi:hypothetical protein